MIEFLKRLSTIPSFYYQTDAGLGNGIQVYSDVPFLSHVLIFSYISLY